jgi:hypothetical protein
MAKYLDATKIEELANGVRSASIRSSMRTILADIATADIEPQTAIADLDGGASLADTIAKVNAILAALRAAGVIATE